MACSVDTVRLPILPAPPTRMQKLALAQDTSSSTDQFAPFGLPSEIGLNPLAVPDSTSWVEYFGFLKCSPTATQAGMLACCGTHETPSASATGPSLPKTLLPHSLFDEDSCRPFT